MAKIAFLSLVFPPDSVSTAHIMGELALELKKLGHDVEVLTTSPHYNRDIEAEAKQPLRNFWGSILRKSDFHGISVYHILMPKKKANILARLLSWLNFHILSSIAGLWVLTKPDLFIVPSPPLTMGVNAWLLCLFHKSQFIYNVQELYPDYAISLGVVQKKWLIKSLYSLESFVYTKAVAVTTIASHMAGQLLEKGVPNSKVKVIPNFTDIDKLHPLPKENDFSRQYQVNSKFVVSYAGNMGPGQDIDTFVSSASLLQDHPNIHFLMMGNGIWCEKLKKRIQDENLSNFTFLDYQPYSLIPQIYAASDLCLVPQLPSITHSAVPSKVYRIMACARPVLASTAPESDLASLIDKVDCGIIVEGGSHHQLAEAILWASKKPEQLRAMGEAGRAHVVECYSRKAISKQYHVLAESILKKSNH